jgi:hypothetical protein
MKRRTHESRKEEKVEMMEAKRTSTQRTRHSHKWMKMIEQPKENGTHKASSRLKFS